jgi:hypothetical protein
MHRGPTAAWLHGSCCGSGSATSATARRCDRGSGVRRQTCRGISDRLHGCPVARSIGFAAYFLDLPFHFRHCRFRHWSHILLPPPHVGCCIPPTIRGKARVHLMRKASILERLTIALVALLLVAALVLGIRYDIERTAAPRFLPPALTTLGFACLAFNVRIIQPRSFRPAPAVRAMSTWSGLRSLLCWPRASGNRDRHFVAATQVAQRQWQQ